MITAAAIFGVFLGLIAIVLGLAGAFIPTYGMRQGSPVPGLTSAAFGLAAIVGCVAVLAIM